MTDSEVILRAVPSFSSTLAPQPHKLAGTKICFLAGTLEHGGAERQLLYILQALCGCGAAPRLLCMDRGEFWENAIRQSGVGITWVGQRGSRLRRLFRIVKALREDPPDVLQSQHFFTNAYVSIAASLLGIKGIGAMRNDGASEVRESGRLGGWLNLHLPKTIAANSRIAIQYAISQGIPAGQFCFLPNVVDTEQFVPSRENAPADHPLTLLIVGRLVRQKRLDRFISIVARLRHHLKLNVKGLIVGPARANEDLRPKLERQARELGIFPDGLEFRGAVSNMAPVYQQVGVCVLTSDHEGTPNVLLEAMASGLPVVAPRVGGVPEIVRQGQNGFLLAPDDIDGFVEALSELTTNPALRVQLGHRARSYVERNHSLARLPDKLSELYQAVCPRSNRGAAQPGQLTESKC